MVRKTMMMKIQFKKIFLVMFIVMVIGYGVFTLIEEMREMNVMRWRSVSQEGIKQLENTKINFSKENFLARMEDCRSVNYTDVVFYFTPDISDHARKFIFFIQSINSNFTLYKGKFNPQIVLKGVPYCTTQRGYRPEDVYEDDYDILAFRLFDIENQRAVYWGGLQGYQYYNGKVNRVTLFRDHVDEYDGYYKVEQEDK